MHDLKPAVKITTRPHVNSVKSRMLLRLEENFSFSLSGAEIMALQRGPNRAFCPKYCSFLGLQLLRPARDAIIWRGDCKQVQLRSSGTELYSLFLSWGCSIASG